MTLLAKVQKIKISFIFSNRNSFCCISIGQATPTFNFVLHFHSAHDEIHSKKGIYGNNNIPIPLNVLLHPCVSSFTIMSPSNVTSRAMMYVYRKYVCSSTMPWFHFSCIVLLAYPSRAMMSTVNIFRNLIWWQFRQKLLLS